MPSIKVFTTTQSQVSLSGRYLCLHQVKTGSAVATNENRRHVLVGDGYLIQNVGTPHDVKADSNEVVTICIPGPLLLGHRFEECLTPRDFLLDRAVSNYMTSPKSDCPRMAASFTDEIVGSLLAARNASSQNYYLANDASRSKGRDVTMRAAREFILSRLGEPLSVPDVANHVSVSPFHFHREFTEWHGMTPGRYIVQEKIRRACRRLVLRDDPVSKVALECGFYSPTSFVSSFRSITNLTPSEFRAKQRNCRRELTFYNLIS